MANRGPDDIAESGHMREIGMIGVDQLTWMSLRGVVTALIGCLSLWRDLLEVGDVFAKKGARKCLTLQGRFLCTTSLAGPALMRSNHL
jgi:hypothetical protein